MGTPARFSNGVNNVSAIASSRNLPVPNPLVIASETNDFHRYTAADWTVTNTTTHYTIGLVAAAAARPGGGWLGIVAGGATVNTDVGAVQINPLSTYFTTSQEMWFEAKILLANATNEQVMIGVGASAAAVAPTDGIYFSKAAGSTSIDFTIRAGSSSTTASAVGTATTSAMRFAAYYNGKDAVDAYIDGVKVYSQTTLTNLPASVVMGMFAAIKAGATAPTGAGLYVDYLSVSQRCSGR